MQMSRAQVGRRFPAIVVAAVVLGATLLLVAGRWWLPVGPSEPRPRVTKPTSDPTVRSKIPVFRPLPAPPSVPAIVTQPEGMSEGLAADLEMFNTDQLRAELQSIATSYPEITFGKIACPSLPCRAEAMSADVEQLNRFVEMVTNRFQGHLRTEFRRLPGSETPTIQASFVIGTPDRRPVARYAP